LDCKDGGEPKEPKRLVVQTYPLFKLNWMWIIAGCHVPALFIPQETR
jgi:hypothetical protein